MTNTGVVERFRDFEGGADALTKTAAQLADSLALGLDSENLQSSEDSEGNERLLRHYVSVNVVDRPQRQGRDAIYGYRHLLQYLTARRLLRQGFSLAKIGQYTSVLTTASLAGALVCAPQTSEAELLVAAYKVAGTSSSMRPERYSPGWGETSRSSSKPAAIESIHGMADLLREIEQMRARFSSEVEELRRIADSLDRSVERVMLRLVQEQTDELKKLIDTQQAENERQLRKLREELLIAMSKR